MLPTGPSLKTGCCANSGLNKAPVLKHDKKGMGEAEPILPFHGYVSVCSWCISSLPWSHCRGVGSTVKLMWGNSLKERDDGDSWVRGAVRRVPPIQPSTQQAGGYPSVSAQSLSQIFPLVDNCFYKLSKANRDVFENSNMCRLSTEYMECLFLICSIQVLCKQHMNPKGFLWSIPLLDWKNQWDMLCISSKQKHPSCGGWSEEGWFDSGACTCFFLSVTATNTFWIKVFSEGGKKWFSCILVDEPGTSADTSLLTEWTGSGNQGCRWFQVQLTAAERVFLHQPENSLLCKGSSFIWTMIKLLSF